jgi:leucine dehydrogenase
LLALIQLFNKNINRMSDILGDFSVFNQMAENDHQKVVYCYDKATGLKAIVAIHDTTLGPALGGTRMWNYKSEGEALNDVLRLSRGMTYKAAITGLNLGGGKAVIIGDSKKDKSEAMMRRYGKCIENLNGEYITAEDVGTSPKDMEYIKMETNHVAGIPESLGGLGDPSPVTAYGVYMGMKACAQSLWGNDSLSGKVVAVQGVGHVGENLVKHLRSENAKVYISDINEERLAEISKKYGAEVVANNSLYDLDIDVYAPCALGATVNADTLAKLKCAIIAGAANNQLADEKVHGRMVMEKGILYAPDFLINAGGLINVYSELMGYSAKRAMEKTEHIYEVTLEILKKSREENIPTYEAANRIAEKRIEDIRRIKAGY